MKVFILTTVMFKIKKKKKTKNKKNTVIRGSGSFPLVGICMWRNDRNSVYGTCEWNSVCGACVWNSMCAACEWNLCVAPTLELKEFQWCWSMALCELLGWPMEMGLWPIKNCESWPMELDIAIGW